MKALYSCLFAACLISASCARDDLQVPVLSGTVLQDPQVAVVDRHAPFTVFDGQAGSILLGDGWGHRQGNGEEGDWGSLSWSVARESKLYFSGFSSRGTVFYARCIPFPTPEYVEEAKRRGHTIESQIVTLVFNGQPVGSVALKPEWQEIRIPIPGNLMRAGLQELSLQFSHTMQPSAISNNLDSRDLGAAFSQVAILPADVQDPQRYIETMRSMVEESGFSLRPGRALEIPLPAGSEVDFRLGHVESRCDTCVLLVRFESATGEVKTLWEGRSSDASKKAVSFSTPPAGIGYLRFQLSEAGSDETPGDGKTVRVEIPENFLAGNHLPDQSNKKPNVFLYVIDSLRADVIHEVDRSLAPRIQEFAQDAVTHLNARSPSSWTLPAVVSMLTGTYARTHGVMKGDMPFRQEGSRVLPLMLSSSGYDTFGVSQSGVIGDQYGFSPLFGRFFVSDHLNSFSLRSRTVRKFLMQWLSNRGSSDKPFFAYIHTVDPHAPYSPPRDFQELADKHPGRLRAEKYHPVTFMLEGTGEDAWEVKHLRSLYEGEVKYTDEEFGRFVDLLKYLNLYENSFVILTSDHGEEFAEHGGFDHGGTLYDELLRVPLIVKYPQSLGADTKLQDPVSTIDIAPTVLQHLGLIESATGFDGEPLPVAPVAGSDRVLAAEIEVFAASHRAAVNYKAFMQGDLKCIQSLGETDQFGQRVPEWQIFNLAADPGESTALEASSKEAEACRGISQLWLASKQTGKAGSSRPATKADPETLRKLRSLGYIK